MEREAKMKDKERQRRTYECSSGLNGDKYLLTQSRVGQHFPMAAPNWCWYVCVCLSGSGRPQESFVSG